MKAEKLNRALATNVPLALRIKKRGPSYPETDFNTKEQTGRQVFLYIFEDKDGRELSHYATEPQENTLGLFKEGEWLQVVRKEELNSKTNKRMTHYEFTTPDGAEARAAATPQLHNNTATVRNDRHQEDRDRQQKAKEIQICLQGFAQAIISSGKPITYVEAIQDAVKCRALLQEQVRLLMAQ